ncbi:MAG: hypothetical protein EOO15_23335 [Chitinophagaceae bacterium]|nr:MAG: hypothetical protein EOO15_23335 [Chitinophagaceae bacterium]
MKNILPSKRTWQVIDQLIGVCLAIPTILLGIFAIYFFSTTPAENRNYPDPTEIIMGVGIFAIGLSMLGAALRKPKNFHWFYFASMSFWFLLYDTSLHISRLIDGGVPNMYNLLFSFALFTLTCFCTYKHRHRNAK